MDILMLMMLWWFDTICNYRQGKMHEPVVCKNNNTNNHSSSWCFSSIVDFKISVWNDTKKQSILLFSFSVSESCGVRYPNNSGFNAISSEILDETWTVRDCTGNPNHLRQLAYFNTGLYWLLSISYIIFCYAKVCIWSGILYEFSFVDLSFRWIWHIIYRILSIIYASKIPKQNLNWRWNRKVS